MHGQGIVVGESTLKDNESVFIGDVLFIPERPNVYLISALVDEVARLSDWDVVNQPSASFKHDVLQSAFEAILNGELNVTRPVKTPSSSETPLKIPFIHVQDFRQWFSKKYPNVTLRLPVSELKGAHGEVEKVNQELILSALVMNGYDPQNYVPGNRRNPGAKACAERVLVKTGVIGKGAFRKAWNTLVQRGLIVQTKNVVNSQNKAKVTPFAG